MSGYLLGSREPNKMPLPPKAELERWYHYYFATDPGPCGYDKYRYQFAKFIWQTDLRASRINGSGACHEASPNLVQR